MRGELPFSQLDKPLLEGEILHGEHAIEPPLKVRVHFNYDPSRVALHQVTCVT